VDEIVALEQQRRAHLLREGVNRAVAEIESRFGINALSEASKSFHRHSGKLYIMRNDFCLDESEKVLEVIKPFDAASGAKDVSGLLIGDGANKSPRGGDNRIVECRSGSWLRMAISADVSITIIAASRNHRT